MGATFKVAEEARGPERSLRNHRTHQLAVNGSILDGRLRIIWSFSRQLHHRNSIEKLAAEFLAALEEIIDHCQSAEAGGYTPSDFKDVILDQTEIDALMEELSEA